MSTRLKLVNKSSFKELISIYPLRMRISSKISQEDTNRDTKIEKSWTTYPIIQTSHSIAQVRNQFSQRSQAGLTSLREATDPAEEEEIAPITRRDELDPHL
jgi:hypothetical protein